MASPSSAAFYSLMTLLFFLVVSFPRSVLSQNPISSTPSIAQCTMQLLPLAACASFVQGTSQSPADSCCDNLKLLYSQQPDCLCIVLNGTTLSSFPINATRALLLPALCSLQLDMSPCSGVHVPPSPTAPTSQVFLGPNTNSTIAASPMPNQQAQKPSMMGGIGFGRSANGDTKLRIAGYLTTALANAITGFLVTGVLF